MLSSFLIASFAGYVLYQRGQDSGQVSASPDSKGLVSGNSSQSSSASAANTFSYKDGEYVGRVADAFYGNVQVKAVIAGGKISDVQFLDYPRDRGNSVRINTQAMPNLKTEAIRSQNANVDMVSGATETSTAFRESLASALAQAVVVAKNQ